MQTKREKEGRKEIRKQLSSDSEAFSSNCTVTPQQLQIQKYGVHNASSWDAGLYGDQPNGILPRPPRDENIYTMIELQNRQTAVNYNNLLCKEALHKMWLSLVGFGGHGLYGNQSNDALPCAPSDENINSLIELLNRQKVLNYNTLLCNEELCKMWHSLASIGGQGAIPITWNGMPNSNTFFPSPQLNVNYPSTPRNQAGLAFGSVKDDEITPTVDLASLCPPKQSIVYTHQDFLGADNFYLNSVGMNFQPAGNPKGTVVQPSQSKGEGSSTFNAAQKLIQAALILGSMNSQAPPINNFGPLGARINEEAPSTVQLSPAMAAAGSSSGLNQTSPLNWSNLNHPSTEFQLKAAMGGYGGQAPSLGRPFGWPMQPNFKFPVPGSGDGGGFNPEAAAALLAKEHRNAAPFRRNYPR